MIPEYYNKLVKLYEKIKIPILEYEVPENFDVVDEYWIVPNFSKVQIRRNKKTLENIYYLIEPALAVLQFFLFPFCLFALFPKTFISLHERWKFKAYDLL